MGLGARSHGPGCQRKSNSRDPGEKWTWRQTARKKLERVGLYLFRCVSLSVAYHQMPITKDDHEESNEDILKDSLAFLGGDPVVDDNSVTYGPLTLTIAPKVSIVLPTLSFAITRF